MSADAHRDSLQLLRREPALFAMELLWRWSFGLGMLALLLYACARLHPVLIFTEGDAYQLNTQNPYAIAETLLRIFQEILPELTHTVALLTAPALALWVATRALGRGVLTRMLMRRFATACGVAIAADAPRWASFALLACARVLTLLILVIGYLAGGLMAAMVDPAAEYIFVTGLVVLLALVVSVVLWSWVNWLLGFASIMLVRDGLRPLDAIVAGIRFASRNRPRLLAIAAHNASLRGLAAVVITVAGILTVALGLPAWLVAALLLLQTLAYFVVADFLLLARLGAYAGVAARELELPKAAAVAGDSRQPVS